MGRTVLGSLTLALVLGCGMSVGRCADTQSPGPQNAVAPSVKVVAYYFHATIRCATCQTIEKYSREALELGFGEELKNGSIAWKPLNTQLPENRHYVDDYRLTTRSLVLVRMQDGKQVEWRNLEKVWDLVGSKPDFLKYVQTNVRDYLGGS